MRRGWHAAGRPRQPVLFVNPRSGGGAAERSGIVERAREQGIEAVVLAPGQSLAALAQAAAASGADALGMAGGDGSLAVVAAAAAAHDLPFVCIPAGTRNHFALDVGIDRQDLPGALDAFSNAVERRIDMAEVNGRLFLNNVSLGIYGERGPAAGLPRCQGPHPPGNRAARTRPQRTSAGAGPHRRCRARAPPAGCAARLEQPLRAGPARSPRHPPGTRHRPARGHGPRRTGQSAASSGASLDRGVPGGGRARNGTRRDRRGAAIAAGRCDSTIRPASLRVRISRRHPGASPSARFQAEGRAPALARPSRSWLARAGSPDPSERLADRISAFLRSRPRRGPAPDPVDQLRRLYFDLAGLPFPARFLPCSASPAPASCCTAATTPSRQRAASSCRSRPSAPRRCPLRAPPGSR